MHPPTTAGAGPRLVFHETSAPSPVLRVLLALVALLTIPARALRGEESLPGGRRPLQPELDGQWIDNGVCFSPFRPGQAPGEEGALMKGEVSVIAQENCLRQHSQWVNRREVVTLLFEAFDEGWEGGGRATPPNVVEKHWGVFDEARPPKPSFAAIIRAFNPKNWSRFR